VICTWYVCVRLYEQVYGWVAGLDSFASEFTTYWMTILYTQEPVELVAFLGLIGWMWKTRDKDVANIEPREEVRRIFTLLCWIFVYSLAVTLPPSFIQA
jgi:methane/ammonia monooxygenase subunit C